MNILGPTNPDAQSKPSEGPGDKVTDSSPEDTADKEAADKPSSVSPEPMDTDTNDTADKGPKLPARAPSPAAAAPKLPTAAPPPAVKPVKPARSGFDILNVFEEVRTHSIAHTRIGFYYVRVERKIRFGRKCLKLDF